MAMAKDYVGQYGETLRRLTALDAQAGAYAQPQSIGGADVAQGAFAAPAQPQPGAFGAGSAQPAPGAFEVPAPVAPGSAAPAGDPPTTFKDLTTHMPDDQKDQIADQIEQSVGGNLKATYATEVAKQGDTPKKGIDKRDMALYLAEVAMRAFANGAANNGGANAPQAIAQGAIQALDRRENTRLIAEERARQDAEKRRLEGREDAAGARKRAADVEDREDKQGHDSSENAKNRASQAYLQKLQNKAAELREKGKKTQIVVAEDGTYKLLDDAGNAVTVTETVTEEKGGRGGKTKVTTQKPVKAKPKNDTSGLDQDTVLRQITERVKELKKDSKLMREMRKGGKTGLELEKALEAEARRQVTEAAGEIESGGGTVTDWNDFK